MVRVKIEKFLGKIKGIVCHGLYDMPRNRSIPWSPGKEPGRAAPRAQQAPRQVETGDSTVFAKMARVNNAAYVWNLKLIAKLDTPTPVLVPVDKDTQKPSKGMTLNREALDTLTKAVADKLPLGGSNLAKEFGWVKPGKGHNGGPKLDEVEPEPATEPAAPILMIVGPEVQNSALDLVLAYMTDMTVADLGRVQERYVELMNAKLADAA